MILLVAALALAGFALLLFGGTVALIVVLRRPSAPGALAVKPRGAPVQRPAKPMPPVSVVARPSYFDDDPGDANATTTSGDRVRMRSATDNDHDEHTELFSKAEVEAEL